MAHIACDFYKVNYSTVSPDGWFYTNDIGYYDNDGDIFVMGRKSNLINFKGYYYSPITIENFISRYSAVDKVAVVATKNEQDVDHPTAYILKKPGQYVDAEAVIAEVDAKFDDHMKLRGGIKIVNEMPGMIDGNIDRRTRDIGFFSNMAYENVPFTVKDNVLIGQRIPCEDLDNVNIGKLILKTLKSQPNHIAQIDAETGKKITFDEIRNISVKLAIWMKNEDIFPGDLVGICTNHHVGMYALLACLYIGAVPIVLKYNQHANEDISYHFVRTRPKVIFFDKMQPQESELTDKEDDMRMVLSVLLDVLPSNLFNESSSVTTFTYKSLISRIDEYYNQMEVDCFTCTELDQFRLETMAIIYTRGSNDLNKAVRISHKAVMSLINQEFIAALNGSTGMWVGPLYLFPNLIIAIHSILKYKQTIKFEGDDMRKMCTVMKKYEVNWVRLETNLCQTILDSGGLLLSNVSSLKLLIFNGSRMDPSFYTELTNLLPICCGKNTVIMSLYGKMETGIISFQKFNRKPGSSGHVGKNVRLKITNFMSETPLGPNMPGDIWCNCWGVSEKYYDTNDVNNMCVTNSEGWHCTGDVGYYDEDGDIYVTNRVEDLVNFREFCFSPTIIEKIIKEEPAVDEVAVVAMPHNVDTEHPMAFITIKKGERMKKKDIENIAAEKLWNCMQLRGGVMILDRMPHGSDGNVDRSYLRRVYKKKYDEYCIP
ncbi:Luciferin 4-monooxygenase [Harpegnathos saltator]|uniref:Luciferin 4-monooxygenase n=1 Tax=Harpegnathos saltator TaxID=610380 RepID=E2BAQ3_HARSA|nr:Luciferin 4-monooxygenase [Harpegnathos saltator]